MTKRYSVSNLFQIGSVIQKDQIYARTNTCIYNIVIYLYLAVTLFWHYMRSSKAKIPNQKQKKKLRQYSICNRSVQCGIYFKVLMSKLKFVNMPFSSNYQFVMPQILRVFQYKKRTEQIMKINMKLLRHRLPRRR